MKLNEINIGTSLTSRGTASIATLSVDGDSTIAGALSVAEDALLSKVLYLNDQLISNAPASFNGAVTTQGPLLASGPSTFLSTSVAGSFSAPQTCSVSGALTISDSLTVAHQGGGGALASVQVEGALSATGPVLLAGLSVSDTVTLSSTVDTQGALGVDGPSTLQVVTLNGPLELAGSASFGQSVIVTGGVSVGGVVGLGGAALIDGSLTVEQTATLSGTLEVGLDADVSGDLTVATNSIYKENLVVDGDLLVQGAMRTRHNEQVFVGDSHLVLNSGGIVAGASASGFASVYSVDQVLCADAIVTFLGGTSSTSGGLLIPGMTEASVTQNNGRIVSVTGGSPYDGLYLLDGSNGAAPRLYSTDVSAVDWTLRMPFLNVVTWGPSLLNAADVQAPGVSVSIVQVSHFLVDSSGAIWFARGGGRADFWTQAGATSYTRLSVDGGDTSFAELTADGVLDRATTSLRTGGIVAYLSPDDKLGVTRKIINNSGAACTISAPQGNNIDGLPSFTLNNHESIVLTKFDEEKYAGWFAVSSTGSAYVSIFGYGKFTYKLLDDPSTFWTQQTFS